jgi:hypothetical protein
MTTCSKTTCSKTTGCKLTILGAALAAASLLLAAGAPAQASPVCTGPNGPCSSQRYVAACHYERLHYPNKWVCTWPSVSR